jgi:large subunit ribosomal protein L6
MSRLGKKEIVIPAGVEVSLKDGSIVVKGPKGELVRKMDNKLSVAIEAGALKVEVKKTKENLSALWGAYASHIMNMIEGVTKGFSKKLQIEGIGYKVELKGTELVFGLGFSHPVIVKVPEGLTALVEKNMVTISGIDKERVGAFAAGIRDQKKPEPYKGKGIRYEGEYVAQKQGKKSA